MVLMILAVVIGLPLLDIYVLVQVGSRIGLVNTVFALLLAAVLGAGFAKAQGRFIQRSLQQNLALGQLPTDQVIHGMLVFVGGVLFLIPGFVSDAIGLLLILPGTRHLMAWFIRRRLQRQFATGGFRVFSSGMGVGGFRASGGFGSTSGFGRQPPFHRPEPSGDGDLDFGRDVTPKVIDVTPISVSKNSSGSQDPSGSKSED